MSFETIILERDEPIATLVLNRPAKRNSFNEVMVRELESAFTELAHDVQTKVVVLTSVDDVAFCAGADYGDASKLTPEDTWQRTDAAGRMRWRLITLPQPTIAAVAGYAYGGGAELATSCDLCIAAHNAKFRFPGASIGRITGTQRLPRLIGLAKAKELVFTARVVEATEAERIGLVLRSVPVAELRSAARELALALAQNSSYSLQTSKRLFNETFGEDHWVGFVQEREAIREAIFSEEGRERFLANFRAGR
jgi:enoyl-CoA hydratase/carnithine racemase